MSNFTVYVSDNYHGGDDDGPCRAGEFESLGAAIEKCKQIIDEFLEERHQGGMNAAGMLAAYKMFGEDPFIVGDNGAGMGFSGWTYARESAERLCA